MSTLEKETTKSAADLFGPIAGARSIDATSQSKIDYDAVGQDYLRQALRKAANDRFNHDCPPQYRSSDWSHPGLVSRKAQIDQILAWRPTGKGLLAAGPSGRGKTRAMWGLIRTLSVDLGLDVRSYHASQWFSKLAECMVFGRDDAQGWIESVARRPLVFIDDLGQESVRSRDEDWAQGWFLRFLDIRVGLGLPLLATTNLGARELAGGADEIRQDPLLRRLLDSADVVRF